MNVANPTTRRAGRKSNAQKAAEAAAASAALGEAPEPAQPVRVGPAPTRAASRQVVREPAREAHRAMRGGVVAQDRDGNILTRSRPGADREDIMEIPAHEIPAGWEYQWNTVSIYNEPMTSAQNTMWANGWRPVPSERHPGRFMPLGHKGDIIHAGARLEERPRSLSDEARQEDMAKARMQQREQNAMMMAKGRMGDLAPGMSMDGERYRGVNPNVRTSIGPEGEAPRAAYEREE